MSQINTPAASPTPSSDTKTAETKSAVPATDTAVKTDAPKAEVVAAK